MVFAPGFIVVGDSPINNAVSTYGIINWEQHIVLPNNTIINGYGVAADMSGNVVITGTSNNNNPNLIVSTNGGLTWSNVIISGSSHIFKTQGYGVLKAPSYNGLTGKVFIAYGHDDNSQGGPHICYGICANPNGWQVQNFSLGNQGYIRGMATDNSGTFMAVGSDGNSNVGHIRYSTNSGVSWTNINSGIFATIGKSVAHGKIVISGTPTSGFVLTGDGVTNDIYYCRASDPAGTMTPLGNPFGSGGYGNSVSCDTGTNWLVAGKSATGTNHIYYSSNGTSFIQVTGGPSVEVFAVYYNELYSGQTGEPYWFAVGNSGSTQSIYYSTLANASVWIPSTGTQPAISRSIASGIIEVACIAKGTKISTPLGYIPVEDLHEGDVILINKGEYANIRKIFHRTVKVTPTTAPYRIPGGDGHEDLTISPTHSVFVRGQMIEAQFLGYPHDDRYTDVIEYYNISVDGDENTVMYANGVPIETYRERNSI